MRSWFARAQYVRRDLTGSGTGYYLYGGSGHYENARRRNVERSRNRARSNMTRKQVKEFNKALEALDARAEKLLRSL